MSIITTNPRGTADVTPEQSGKWQFIENTLRKVSAAAGLKEIRTPTFEHTELFARGVGDTTDVVQKEMYTFSDKGERSITLRPEGTAGVVRAFIQNGLFNAPAPVRLFYFTSCFRYEKPQAGRLREFHQYGVEFFGSADAAADAEVISLADSIFSAFGISDQISLKINSIGCRDCRAKYNEALKAFFDPKKDCLCSNCVSRLERNPMRLIDCKVPSCKEAAVGAPVISDYLCGECKAHFESLKARLSALGIDYTVDPTIVRGLDYYNRTVFEFVSDAIGAQGTVLGGGRYDPLTAMLGGPDTPALGFGMGIERLLLLLENGGRIKEENTPCRVYLVSAGENANIKAQSIANALRRSGVYAECDVCGRSVKAQMKQADKLSALYTAVIGDDELASGVVRLRNMQSGEIREVGLSEICDIIM